MKEIAKIAWKSPSNIAFIKYWGKRGVQLPRNPSLSMTLDKCSTETSITLLQKKRNTGIDFKFIFEERENIKFSERIEAYLNGLTSQLAFLEKYSLLIESKNNFPHSTGIASSASGMSALALGLASIEQRLNKAFVGDLYPLASYLARLGSGSASRSVYKEFAVWGKTNMLPDSSDEFAVELKAPVHNNFRCMRDTILIVDNREKKVSSKAGHSLMENHPYAEQRFRNANLNFEKLVVAMGAGDFKEFAVILEHEALSLHAMMLTSEPWYSLLEPNTLKVIQLVRKYREEVGIKVAFTIDAGPNVHLIYPADEDEKIKGLIETELLQYCMNGQIIKDNIGLGPELLIDEFR